MPVKPARPFTPGPPSPPWAMIVNGRPAVASIRYTAGGCPATAICAMTKFPDGPISRGDDRVRRAAARATRGAAERANSPRSRSCAISRKTPKPDGAKTARSRAAVSASKYDSTTETVGPASPGLPVAPALPETKAVPQSKRGVSARVRVNCGARATATRIWFGLCNQSRRSAGRCITPVGSTLPIALDHTSSRGSISASAGVASRRSTKRDRSR